MQIKWQAHKFQSTEENAAVGVTAVTVMKFIDDPNPIHFLTYMHTSCIIK